MINFLDVACDFRHDLHPYSLDTNFKDSRPSFIERLTGIAIFILSIPLTLGIGTAFLLYTAHRKVVRLDKSKLDPDSSTNKLAKQSKHLSEKFSSDGRGPSRGKDEPNSGPKEAEQFYEDVSNDKSVKDTEIVSDVAEVNDIAEISQVTIYSAKEFENLVLKGYQFSGKIRVEGDVYFYDTKNLTSLPQNLKVEGDLYLNNCTNLTSLPQNLKVGGDLDLDRCTSLTSLPQNLEVGISLSLRHCTSLTSLPNNLVVEGHLYLKRCTNLTSLPQNLEVGGCLNLSDCTSLTSLPQNLKVKGYLDLNNCTNLTSLPQNLEVGGCLDLSDCTSLTSLPQNLKVEGDLYLNNCTSLTSLPQNLKVEGDLYFNNCTSLTSLPQNLKVEDYLYLNDCTSLTSLPEDLDLGGNLYLSGCTSLTSLPNSITELGYRSDGEMRVIDLTRTGLSTTVIQNLQQSEHPGIQFHYSQEAQQPSSTFTTLDQGLQFWAELAKKQAPHVEINGLSCGNVRTYLSRLTTTQEYKNLQSRKYLAERVIDVFKLMREDNGIKEHAVNLIEEGLSSCDDRIISALNEIELMVQVNEIEKDDHNEKDLKTLGKRFLLLEMVNKKAAEHIETLSFVDEIEVYLAFQIGLADRFKLPIKTRNMIFRNCADVTDQKIKEYGDTIEEECTEEKLNTYLESWNPWVKLQKSKVKVPLYDELPLDNKEYKKDDFFCIFLQDKPERPVSYKGFIYDYKMFIGWYKTNGTDPLTREKIDLEHLKKVEAL